MLKIKTKVLIFAFKEGEDGGTTAFALETILRQLNPLK